MMQFLKSVTFEVPESQQKPLWPARLHSSSLKLQEQPFLGALSSISKAPSPAKARKAPKRPIFDPKKMSQLRSLNDNPSSQRGVSFLSAVLSSASAVLGQEFPLAAGQSTCRERHPWGRMAGHTYGPHRTVPISLEKFLSSPCPAVRSSLYGQVHHIWAQGGRGVFLKSPGWEKCITK